MDEDEDMHEPGPGPDTSEVIRFGEAQLATKDAKAAAVARGNVNVHSADTLELPEESSHAKMLQEEALKEMEARRRMRVTIVPTNVEAVKRVLRSIGEPATLFGERPDERRDRLKRILSDKSEEEQEAILAPVEDEAEVDVAPRRTEKFYTEGGQELQWARRQIALFSLKHARQRLMSMKRKRDNPDEDEAQERKDAEKLMSTLVNQASEIGDERPLTSCEFSPQGLSFATASVAGTVKVWDIPDLNKKLTIKAHDARVTGLAWHPRADAGSAVALGSGAADCSARLWSRAGQPIQTLTGHTQRLGRVGFHPMGSHFGTASFDGTWRLWDIESADCLLEQEGHSRAVYALAFHPDGSLVASGGLDAFGRIWDVRTGRSVMVLEGHVKGILSTAFSPDGFHVATGSEDNTARLWDLRKRSCLYTFPAHQSTVAMVRFDPEAGHFLVTSSFDRLAKVWSTKSRKLLKRLAGHEGHVACVDMCPDGSNLMATVSQDRTIKLWAPDEFAEANDEEAMT